MPNEILDFWFDEIDPKQWFASDPDFDALIRARFLDLMHRAAAGELYAWRDTAAGRLAEIIVLDQFSRNVYRGTAQAFAQDGIALVLAQEAVANGAMQVLEPTQRSFCLLPYMHSESALIHGEAEALYKQFTEGTYYDFEVRHKAIIDRFGRYPHRNAVLGRTSTPAELVFLSQPGSAF